jgi:hypothetical protein
LCFRPRENLAAAWSEEEIFMDGILFEVGGTHENEKGTYEVLSMDEGNDAMVIKWESGEEATTAISFQRRILERMHAEREAAKTGNGNKRRPGASSATFDGFEEADFSGRISGTTWRTQKGLGGVVTRSLNSDGFQIKSWAVPRVPEAHWVDANQQDTGKTHAKFFVRLDRENLRYGFHVARCEDSSENHDHWKNLLDWLSNEENESRFKEIVDEYDLRICDRKDKAKPFEGQIRVAEGHWHLENGTDTKAIGSLADFLSQLPETNNIDLQIAKTTNKKDAIGRGEDLAGDITVLFDTLVPLFKAST